MDIENNLIVMKVDYYDIEKMRKDLNHDEYQSQFNDTKREKALQRAWLNRDFEIQMYWKRATYFWAFIASSFAAYFVVTRETGFDDRRQLELIVSSLGLIFSIAWFQVNRGSKKWQENWEKHIDLLEEEVTGPIYKTVLNRNAPSVSGMNKHVSVMVSLTWLYLVLGYFIDFQNLWMFQLNLGDTLIILIVMFSLYNLLRLDELFKKKNDTFFFSLRLQKYKNKFQN